MSEVNVKINGPVNVRQSRGAGTVLVVVLFWWLLVWWWMMLACAWIIWMPIAGIISIWQDGFFARNWYQPWPAWMSGIR